jgi:hypothetical protein
MLAEGPVTSDPIRLEIMMKSKYPFLSLFLTVVLAMIACSDAAAKTAAGSQPSVDEAVNTAVDAYIYGYSLITTEVTRAAGQSGWERSTEFCAIPVSILADAATVNCRAQPSEGFVRQESSRICTVFGL